MSTPFEQGRAELVTGRRTLIKAGAGGLAFSAAATLAGPAAATSPLRPDRRVYVVVIDGTRPDEIDSGLTPRLHALRTSGLRFPRASSLPVMETIPNHVMMMTGLRPDRTRVPANQVFDRTAGVVRTLDQPSDLRTPSLLDRLANRGLRTGSVLSKEYLYGIFGTRASYRWEPQPIIPVSGHAPDTFTMAATIEMIDAFDPHLVFVNLGDIDRFGHSDLTGPVDVEALRRVALLDTDRLVGQLVDHLVETGRWEHSMMVVLADHSMDWSLPTKVVSLAAPLAADPMLAGRVEIADNGGADLVYWTGPAGQRAAAVERIRAIATTVPGVLVAHATAGSSLRVGPLAGDVLVWCRAGWRFSDPDPVTSNPIPGNHGHPVTEPIPFFVAGGEPSLPRRTASSVRAFTVDVAPTVGEFLGLQPLAAGYDGQSRLSVR